MNKLPIVDSFSKEHLRIIFSDVRGYLENSKDKNLYNLINILQEKLYKYLSNSDKPIYKYNKIYPTDQISKEELDQLFLDISNNIALLYSQSYEIRDNLISLFNYSSSKIAGLKNKIDDLYSSVVDLRLLSKQNHEEVLVFTDTFVDDSNIDSSFALENPQCSVTPEFGGLTLERSGASRVSSADAFVSVSPVSDLSRDPSPFNLGRFYEGHFYDYLGKAEPEGGSFHISELDNKDISYEQEAFHVPTPPETRNKEELARYKKELKNFVVPGGFEEKFLEQVKAGIYNFKAGVKNNPDRLLEFVNKQRRIFHRKDAKKRKIYLFYANNPSEAEKQGIDLDTTPKRTIDDIIFVDEGADEEKLQEVRGRILDGNPASYWQCELVRESSAVKSYIANLIKDDKEASLDTNELKLLVSTPEVDKEDFEVEMIINLSSPKQLSWIVITPAIFDDGVFPTITDVSTSPDDTSEFSTVDSFSASPRVITNDTNITVKNSDAKYTMSNSSFAFRGSLLLTMSSREVKRVKLRIKQKTPVPNPHELTVLEAVRTVTRVR